MHPLPAPAKSVLLSGAVALLSSCSLDGVQWGAQSLKPKAGTPLQAGVRYEVRKALPASVATQAQSPKRYYFVYEPPRPPLKNAGMTPSDLDGLSPGSRMTVRTTAYCHDEADHLVYGERNALGTPLKFGALRSAAADWSRYPVGTLFKIAGQPDVVYEVDDYGSALVGTGTIDLYKPNRGMMNDWGVRNVEIEVIRWGSYHRSMSIMRERTRWPHVRRMIEGIQTQVSQNLPATRSQSKGGAYTAAL
jgi:3D (Asp-Asp-Asp) domain-containing protein